MIASPVGDGDAVRSVRELDRNALPAGRARTILTLLAHVALPDEETHSLTECHSQRGPISCLRHYFLQLCFWELRRPPPDLHRLAQDGPQEHGQ
eukprot:1400216-Pyramimonas_sp.AAC.1